MTGGYRIARVGSADSDRLAAVTRMCMATVLETIPEFSSDADIARRALPNFTYDEMYAMLERSASSAAHRILIALANEEEVVGYSIVSVKTNENGERFGYLFSRGVVPEHRRKGVASLLLENAEQWLTGEGVAYLQAETHTGNEPLRHLLERNGFTVVATEVGAWPYHTLRKQSHPA